MGNGGAKDAPVVDAKGADYTTIGQCCTGPEADEQQRAHAHGAMFFSLCGIFYLGLLMLLPIPDKVFYPSEPPELDTVVPAGSIGVRVVADAMEHAASGKRRTLLDLLGFTLGPATGDSLTVAVQLQLLFCIAEPLFALRVLSLPSWLCEEGKPMPPPAEAGWRLFGLLLLRSALVQVQGLRSNTDMFAAAWILRQLLASLGAAGASPEAPVSRQLARWVAVASAAAGLLSLGVWFWGSSSAQRLLDFLGAAFCVPGGPAPSIGTWALGQGLLDGAVGLLLAAVPSAVPAKLEPGEAGPLRACGFLMLLTGALEARGALTNRAHFAAAMLVERLLQPLGAAALGVFAGLRPPLAVLLGAAGPVTALLSLYLC